MTFIVLQGRWRMLDPSVVFSDTDDHKIQAAKRVADGNGKNYPGDKSPYRKVT